MTYGQSVLAVVPEFLMKPNYHVRDRTTKAMVLATSGSRVLVKDMEREGHHWLAKLAVNEG